MKKIIVLSLSAFLALGCVGQISAMEVGAAEEQDTLSRWTGNIKKGFDQAKDWLARGEHLGYYVPGLAQGLAASGEFMLTGDKTRAAEGLARGLYLTASGHLAPKLGRLGYNNPKLIPALTSAAPAFLASNLYAIRNQPWQNMLTKANLSNKVDTLVKYGVSPFNLIPYTVLGYGVPEVGRSIAQSPMPWKAAAAITGAPWISYLISRYGIHADLLHKFLDNNPAIYNFAERLLLGGVAPAIIASVLFYKFRDKLSPQAEKSNNME